MTVIPRGQLGPLHLVISIACLLVASALLAAEAEMPRHPAPMPDGSAILLSWQGDIWVVPAAGGQARRITAHPANERHPVVSRDGRWIAFASDRHGNGDVLVMPADGGAPPVRLTYASTDDVPVDFTPDGSRVIFTSRRAESIHRNPGLYSVPLEGGTPSLIQPALGMSAAFSPSGEALAFVRGGTKELREGYRGAASRDLWLRPVVADSPWLASDPQRQRSDHGEQAETSGYVRLTDFDGDDDLPCWIGEHELVFLSARSGPKNLFRLDLTSGETTQLTHHATSARYPRASADGSLVAYELEAGIWTLRPATGEIARLEVDVPLDRIRNRIERRTATASAQDLAVSPDGSLAAFVVEGDLYLTAITSADDQEIAPPPTRRLTHAAARESAPAWSPDGKRLIFTSAQAGNDDIWELRPADPEAGWIRSFEYVQTQLTDREAEERDGVYSPDGSRIAYRRGKGDLLIMKADGSTPRVVLEHWQTPSWGWSPDGRWIAYSIPDAHYNTEVWLVNVDQDASTFGVPYNVSRHPDDDLAPRFSPDGRRLLWLSRRHADELDVWAVWLCRADHERSKEEWLQEWRQAAASSEIPAADPGASASSAGGAAPDPATEPSPKLPEVVIDLDGLWERAIRLTETIGDEGEAVPSPDGRSILFTAEHEGERDLYSIRWDGKDLQRLTKGGQSPDDVQLRATPPVAFYLDEAGAIKRVDLKGEPGDPIPFAARVEIDRRARREQVLTEAWRALTEWFYDPEMHGVDWPAMRDAYLPLAMGASTEADLADVMNMMLGQLNASHMGYYPPPNHDGQGDETGWLGLVVDPSAGGPGLLITEVLPDSPVATLQAAVKAGERLLAVDSETIDQATNLFELLEGTEGRRIQLRLLNHDGEPRSAAVIPVSYNQLRRLRYDQWVRQRRALTERLSGGRIGYIHVQSMDMPSFEELEQGLFAAADGKQGLIVDVRSNGGGWTTDYLMGVLMVRRHAYTVPRDEPTGELAYPQSRLPLAAWTGPAMALCNTESYSNAEIFSWAFKTLERGLLVGSPTFGAVISTGATRLLDGARLRLPMRGWYVAGSGINMEHHGVVPDLVVDQPPELDTAGDRDLQLERAVAAFLEGIEADPRYGAW